MDKLYAGTRTLELVPEPVNYYCYAVPALILFLIILFLILGHLHKKILRRLAKKDTKNRVNGKEDK